VFTIDDLWRIMEFLKDGTTNPNLSELTTTLATSEKEITNSFFEQILDQQTFNSEDYRRLRTMIIDWYSSHKTISTTQKLVSDVHTLPDKHLSELFKSFGFPIGLNLVPLTSKANFFLDLVNFYKKKGTPETLVDVLDYYGFSDTDLIEYWLQKDQHGNIIFRGTSVRLASAGSTLLLDSDVPYDKLVSTDPHWFQTKDQIENLIQTKKINLPSKTPYFSLSSIFSLFTITISLSILFRVVEDQYDRYMAGQEIANNILVKNLGLILPILDVYVGTIYAFERMFGYGSTTTFTRYNCYNGSLDYIGDPPLPQNLSNLTKVYEDLISRPISRLDRDTRLVELINSWTRPLSQNFLNSINASEPFLEALNPNFKAVIDSWFDVGDQSYLITYLIGTLDNWIRLNIDSKSPSLVITMLGLGFRDELMNIINFFKPYRARLAYMDTAYSIKNPLTESVILDEWLLTQIEQNQHDSIRPPGGYCEAISQQQIDDIENFDWYALIDEWKWDKGKFFDQPPVAPKTPVKKSILPISGCENLEWWYDIGKKYDIPIPPEYLNFKYDSGGYYDIIPYLQRCLMELIKHHPKGGLCDYVDYKIGTFYHDRVGMRNRFDRHWDEEASFDSGIEEQWADKIIIEDGRLINDEVVVDDTEQNKVIIVRNYHSDFDTGGSFDGYVEEVVTIPSNPMIDINQSFRETFGNTPPLQMDRGDTYDTDYSQAIVRDEFYIEISYRGYCNISSNVGRYPTSFDSGNTYDRLTDLTIDSPHPVNYDLGGVYDTVSALNMFDENIFEFLSGSINCSTNINVSHLVGGGIENFLGYVDISSDVEGIISLIGVSETLSSSINIFSNILSNLYTGAVTELLSSSITISNVGGNPELIVSGTEELSSSSNINTTIQCLLTIGIMELISTNMSISSTVYNTELIIGLFESLTSVSNIESNTLLDPNLIVVNSLYNPKSFIIDIENNYGDSTDLALMGVRFARGGIIYDIGTPGLNYTSYATSTKSSGSYAPWRVFFDGSSLTGTVENWASNSAITNQRLICNFGNTLAIDEIIFYNYHASGTNTDRGIKNIKIYLSDNNQSNTSYGSTITSSTLVYEGSIGEHTSVDEENPQSITIGVYKGTVSINSNVTAQELEFDVVSTSTTITSNVNGSLDIGFNESLLSSSNNITTDCIADLNTGLNESLLSSSNNITTNCIADLNTGDVETLLSSSNNITTTVNSNIELGNIEELVGNSNVISTIYSILEIELIIRGSSNSIVDTNVNLEIELLIIGSSNSYTIVNSVIDTGDNEELVGSFNITTIVNSNIELGEIEELFGSSNLITNTNVNLEIELVIESSSNYTSNVYNSILNIGQVEILNSNSAIECGCDASLTVV